jgi:hypothetical protein
MTKKLICLTLSLVILLSATAALAAVPADSLTYKTLLKTDDFYLSLKTDSIVWTTQESGDISVSVVAKWAYSRPDRAARYYPAARANTNWRISKVALQYDSATGFIKIMELETTLYDARGVGVAVFKNPNTGWKMLTPTDPDYESVDRIINYLNDTAK